MFVLLKKACTKSQNETINHLIDMYMILIMMTVITKLGSAGK